MLFLFSALSGPGHTFPLIPLAQALQRAGHEVLFATSESAHPVLSQAGLTPIKAGMEIADAFEEFRAGGVDPRSLPPEQMGPMAAKVFVDTLPSAFTPDLVAIIDERHPDVVVRELGNVGAGFAADLRELPVIVHGFGLVVNRSGPFDPETFRATAARLGVTTLRDPVEQPTVDLCPPLLRPADAEVPTQLIPMQPSPFRTPGVVEDLSWRSDRPLIYLTLGTAFGSPAVLRRAVDGLSRLPVDVLVATGPSVSVADLGDLPDNVRAEPWVQQADVLDQAALVAHHGGSGTTLGACAAGARQLLLPQGADQFFNANAVVAAGTAVQLLPTELDPDTLVATATGLMDDPSFADAAARLAADVAAMPTPDAVAAQLPSLISR